MNVRPVICRFTIPGEPQGKGRARSAVLYGRGGRPVMKDGRVIVTHHTPDKTVAYEGLIAHEATLAMAGKPPVEMAVEVRIDIVCSVPASWSLRKTREALAGLIRPAKKPDPDNILKAVADGMNGVVWKDDVQAVDGSWSKRYGTTPGVTVTVMPVLLQRAEHQVQGDLLEAAS
ncbi:MAG: RusA family crossover junction endodeoxyribonuclease [Burkholderiales bacterium]|nr:RusA family crossover junction endodeoxyribonuclease [Burkholderiales bacterium]